MENVVVELFDIASLKRILPFAQDVRTYSQFPHIDFFSIASAFNDFRWEIVRIPRDLEELFILRLILYRFFKAIQDDIPIFLYKNIFQSDVTIDLPASMKLIEEYDDLAKVKDEVRLLDWDGFEKKFPEVSAYHERDEEELFFVTIEAVVRV